jgi:valyl-tRNA synthetase
MKHLGFAADWQSLTFTLDPHICKAVNYAFIHLYQKGLIQKSLRLTNWDPILKTVVSDLEVELIERTDPFWTLGYKTEKGGLLAVATTRPETLFGDVAVAVHPHDPRYQDLIGTQVLIPLACRWIPVIADEAVSMEKGTGAVKITPAHDFLDFEIAQRHQLQALTVLDQEGCLNELAGADFAGMKAQQARIKVIQALGEAVLECQEIIHAVPCSQRSGAVLEPYLTQQWFLDVHDMAAKAVTCISRNTCSFVPKEWENTFFEWMRQIRPWCLSRQLWWGHRIPAWYDEEGNIFVALDEAQALEQARQRWGKEVSLTQDPDVLDTWFSSGLWPFATLGWPDQTPEFDQYYPTSVLVTGFDIIFFWVCRMLMLGLELTGKEPFKHIVIHP